MGPSQAITASTSTGMPKGVIQTHRMMCAVIAATEALRTEAADPNEIPQSLEWMPWNHISAGNIGFNGHKKIKGDKVVAFCDRNCNVIAPFISAPGNQNESPLLRDALPEVTRIAGSIGLDLRGTIVSLDGVYDCLLNRKAIFNRDMVPNINPNPRARRSAKRGRKPFFDAEIFKERFSTIERVFGWEDKFRRLLLRFERLSQLHYAFKSLAYSMINLRHFC